MQKAEQYFQQAIDSDPTYAAAYSGLADCNSGLTWHGFKSPAEALPKAYAAARKAIEIDPQSAEAHASLGLVHEPSLGLDRSGGRVQARSAVGSSIRECAPLVRRLPFHQGRHDEALAEAKRALELDPLNLMISTWVGLRYYLARDYSRAIEQNRNSVELDPNFAAAHLLLGEDYVQAGLHSEGVSELKKAAISQETAHSTRRKSRLPLQRQAGGAKHSESRTNWKQSRESVTFRLTAWLRSTQRLNKEEDTFKWLQAAYRRSRCLDGISRRRSDF